MHITRRYVRRQYCTSIQGAFASILAFVLIVCQLRIAGVHGFSDRHTAALRQEVEEIFYHGYENYMRHAFPEDELRPLTCEPLTRDRRDPTRIDLNDALGNYSLTLIDSLSTLAILASSPSDEEQNKPLLLFQDGVKALVEQYGDGSDTLSGRGLRATGFDLDSKVQVFETVIRGVGGLLSAHLFAVGELPIRGYSPPAEQVAYAQSWRKAQYSDSKGGIQWDNGLLYDGQLLRLAYDLAGRMIPAFWTSTGIPYPRVNLRFGIPFYANSARNYNPTEGQCGTVQEKTEEITETCSAGAGSLVLEFTVLSRLTGDGRFEELSKRAFWAIWNRRSNIGLIGAGIDAETGTWIGSITGIGASIDSFFEYAYKSYVLLQNDLRPAYDADNHKADPRILFQRLTNFEESPEAFLQVWETAHTAIRRHVRRDSNYQHPHYIQVDLNSGAARAVWIDALSAYYPGLLTISGHVEEAIQAHLLATALWTRFSALPERWNLATGGIEGGLGWWIGRPEFIESNYFLYRATEDPWYKHVAEMTISDIKRRCWARCGWAGIQNVITGEKSNRMESFFLGETAKYLFLTFDDEHPLNRLDAPFVFTTEGHPLIIPSTVGRGKKTRRRTSHVAPNKATCPAKPADLPLSVSSTAARGDIYHAASLARLPQMPSAGGVELGASEYALDHPGRSVSNIVSPSNFTYYPWTLPPEMVPQNATSQPMRTRRTFEITFPDSIASNQPMVPLTKAADGITINSLAGLRLSLIQDMPVMQDGHISNGYRINFVNGFGLGKDEKVYISSERGFSIINPADPNFTRIKDTQLLDIIIDAADAPQGDIANASSAYAINDEAQDLTGSTQSTVVSALTSFMSQLAGFVQDSQQDSLADTDGGPRNPTMGIRRFAIPAIISAGKGAVLLPDWPEASVSTRPDTKASQLAWSKIYVTDELCDYKLSRSIPRTFQVIVVKRGGCSFSRKLTNIPSFAPSSSSLKLVVVINYEQDGDVDESELSFRPLLDKIQTSGNGVPRPHPIPMVMVNGADQMHRLLGSAQRVGIKRRYSVHSQGVPIANLVIT